MPYEEQYLDACGWGRSRASSSNRLCPRCDNVSCARNGKSDDDGRVDHCKSIKRSFLLSFDLDWAVRQARASKDTFSVLGRTGMHIGAMRSAGQSVTTK